MVSHPETGSDSPIGSDQDRGRDTGLAHWIAVKHILKYLRRTRNYMLIYCSEFSSL